MLETAPTPARWLKVVTALVRAATWALIATATVLSLFWGALQGWILPRIDSYRPALQVIASEVLGIPVQIGALRAGSGGLVPSVEVVNLQLLDPLGRPALQLPRIQVALSVQSVLRLGFDQLVLDGPELDVRRDTEGRIFLAGIDPSGGGEDTGLADWFLSQREVVVRGGRIRWTDELRGAEPLDLSGVDLVIRNRARRHELRLTASPPAGWGDRFTLIGQFRRPLLSRQASNRADWDGQIFGEFPRADISRLHRHLTLDVQVRQGYGAVRFWGDVVQGQLTGLAADLALARATVQLAPELDSLALQSVTGRVVGRTLAGGFEFQTRNLQFETSDGLVWPGGNVHLVYQAGEGKKPTLGEFHADRLDLAVLGQLASRLPLGTSTHAMLAKHPASGVLEKVEARWQGPRGALQRYEVRVNGRDLELRARAAEFRETGGVPAPGYPGFRGARVDLVLNEGGGQIRFDIANGWAEFPGVFEEPRLAFDRLDVQASWKVQGDAIVVNQASVRFANADAEGQARGSWRTSDPATSSSRSRFPGVLDLQGTIVRAKGARVHRYLPLGIPADVRHYVRDAVVQGMASDVAVRIRGDLWDLPYADPRQGEFRFAGKVRDTHFAFVPRSIQPRDQLPWPRLTALEGELVFDRLSMAVRGARGAIGGADGLRLVRAEAQIADLSHASTVVVTADASGSVDTLLRTLRSSPLSTMTGGVLDDATATGDADYRLRLSLPLADLDRSRVQGSVTLPGNDVQISAATPRLARLRGLVTFSESGFALVGAQARFLGGEVRLDGGTRPIVGGETSVVIRAQGTATAEGLRQAGGDLAFLSRPAGLLSGGTSYSGVLSLRRGVPELSISSSLQGLAINLPAPLQKPAETQLPLRFERQLVTESVQPGARAGTLRDQIALDLGRVLQVRYVRDLSTSQPRVLRGTVLVGAESPDQPALPPDGVSATIRTPALHVDAWEQAAAALTGEAASGLDRSEWQTYLPQRLSIRTGELVVGHRRLDRVTVGASRDGATWKANVDSAQLGGYLEYRPAAGANPGRVFARLAHLRLESGTEFEVESLLDQQPQTVPGLDIVVDELELRGIKMGRVEVEAVNRSLGTSREWLLSRFNISNPEARLQASGRWGVPAAAPVESSARSDRARRRTDMRFTLDITDGGALLARLGMRDVVRRASGRLEGTVAWNGSPLAVHYPTLSGQMAVAVQSGQFLKADPGVAKLLGVLSLQALPRRLTLDFRDVFSAGFAFDFIRGDVTLDSGIARTNNIQMKGINAAVLLDGEADIARETQDLRVLVVPEINAGTASLIATAINPAVGIGSFLAQLVLRQPLIRATTQEFRIDGTWADPRVTRVVANPSSTPANPEGKP